MTHSPTSAEVANKLSEAQADDLLRGNCTTPGNADCLCQAPNKAHLWELGLVERQYGGAIFRTDLGRRVRDAISRARGEHL